MSRRRWPLAIVAGAVLGASLPGTLGAGTGGRWPLGIVGIALLALLLDGCDARARLAIGFAAGVGLYLAGLWWMQEFSLPGFVLCSLLEAAFLALAALLVRRGRGLVWSLPAALVVAEWARGHWPLGGLPLAGLDLGQAGGPLLPAARLGGHLLVIGLVGLGGAALARLLTPLPTGSGAGNRRWGDAFQPQNAWGASVAAAVIVAAAVVGAVLPAGHRAGSLRVAAVQGGGPRGLKAVHRDPDVVFQAQLDASRRVRSPVDLVVWPEDVIDVDHVVGSPEAGRVGDVARGLHAVVVAGAVEDSGPTHFANAVLAWDADGRIVSRYDKVHRVPFGEYIPWRGLIEHVADISAVPRDARPGHGDGVLRAPPPVGRIGAVISYEVFFTGRARAAIRGGGRLLLVPTNAASFRGGQVPAQELATARLRAVETGRDVVQAAPTGYSAFVSSRGRVRTHTRLGAPTAVQGQVQLRSGLTPATRLGELPIVLIGLLLLLISRKVESS